MATSITVNNQLTLQSIAQQLANTGAQEELRAKDNQLYVKEGSALITRTSSRVEHQSAAFHVVLQALQRQYPDLGPAKATVLMRNVLGDLPHTMKAGHVQQLQARGAQALEKMNLVEAIQGRGVDARQAASLVDKALALAGPHVTPQARDTALATADLVANDGFTIDNALARTRPPIGTLVQSLPPAQLLHRETAWALADMARARLDQNAPQEATLAAAHATALLVGRPDPRPGAAALTAAWAQATQIFQQERPQGLLPNETATHAWTAATAGHLAVTGAASFQEVLTRLTPYPQGEQALAAEMTRRLGGLAGYEGAGQAGQAQWLRLADSLAAPAGQLIFKRLPADQRASLMLAMAPRAAACKAALDAAPDNPQAKAQADAAYRSAHALNKLVPAQDMMSARDQAAFTAFVNSLIGPSPDAPAVRTAAQDWANMGKDQRMQTVELMVRLHAAAFNYPQPAQYVQADGFDEPGNFGQHEQEGTSIQTTLRVNTQHKMFNNFNDVLNMVAHESMHHVQAILREAPAQALQPDQVQQRRMLAASDTLDLTKKYLMDTLGMDEDDAHDAYKLKPNELQAHHAGDEAVRRVSEGWQALY